MKTNKLKFPLLQIEQTGPKFVLTKAENAFEELKTESFFKTPKVFERIPMRYLPIPLDRIIHELLVIHVCVHLISLLRRGVQEFTVTDFCKGYIPAWNIVDSAKRGNIVRVTKDIISSLCNSVYGQNMLERQSPLNPPKWSFAEGLDRKNLRSIKKELDEFAMGVKSGQFQGEWDFDSYDHYQITYDAKNPEGK
ncbi:MAG: hypothetical protein WAK60_00710 [Sedimentisphaerales bacterium]